MEIFGPKGIDEFIGANIKVLNFGLSFSILINIVNEGKIFEDKKYLIHVSKANHSITAFSYRFEEKDKPGRFNVQKAKELGIPEGELWNKLQNGQEITNNDKIIKPEQVLGEKRPGKKIGISGDTMPTKELEEFFQRCDYLVFDSTFIRRRKTKSFLDTSHSTAKTSSNIGKMMQMLRI